MIAYGLGLSMTAYMSYQLAAQSALDGGAVEFDPPIDNIITDAGDNIITDAGDLITVG